MNSDEERNWENFLLEVATKRQEQGMTHKDLADNAGTVERTVSRLLSEPTKKSKPFSRCFRLPSAAHISRQAFREGSLQQSRQPGQRRNDRGSERAGAPAPEAVQNTFRSYFCPAGNDDFIPRPDRCK